MEATDVDNYVRISTHTLTWSVTMSALTQIDKSLNFNSHAHVERDIVKIYVRLVWVYFNSHAHVERDDNQHIQIWTDDDFNSHAHVERDEICMKYGIFESNFNSHAHVERDQISLSNIHTRLRFQLTRSRGA